MTNEHEAKIEAVRKHFNSTNMRINDFWNEFYESYGYNTRSGLKKLCIVNNITVGERAKLRNISKGEKTEFNLDELDNFGIAQGIGKEYVSLKLPSELKKIGIMSDIHFPYHSLEALRTAISYLLEQKIDCLYLNGDIFDFYSISRHEKDPDMRDFPREVEMNKEFVQKLRNLFPTIPIYYKLGNHENRYAKSLQINAEEFAQIHELQFDIFFGFDRLDFRVVNDWQGMEMGDLLVLHGHELYGGGGVNPSQNLFNKTICNTLIGHVHRTSNTTKKTGFKQFIHTYSTGCLTSLSPKYMPFSQHNHGFAIVEIEDGISRVKNLVIKDGKVL
jgi:predicted phosphodiesterase